ncbi:class I adenylate-forming enzyme family protein [Nocardia sp. NPDC046763]|uniref:class I adenylate-forming enzyme family protein n=1 Tax=Nocardia sp. NPDC046763 TaxID=3155256 RepID=UPI0033F4BDC0
MLDRSSGADGTVCGLLYSEFSTVATAAPDAPAIIGFDGIVVSYGRLLRAAAEIADILSHSVDSGRIVGLAVDDPGTFLAVYFAVSRIGAVVVLLDSTVEDLTRQCEKFDLDLVVRDGSEGLGSIVIEGVQARGHGTTAGTGGDAHAYLQGDFVVHCTSGSTGAPKGIVMSEPAVLARVRSWAGEAGLTSSDVVLCALPLWHGHGIDVLALPALLSGAQVVFQRGTHTTARGLARAVRTHAVSIVSGLPVMYQMLVAAEGVDRSMLATLRYALTGSAPIAAETQQKFRERFGLPLRQGYGLGEIGIIAWDATGAEPGTVGRPVPGVEWRLVPVPTTGAPGAAECELLVRGEGLARGYYRDSSAESAMFTDGWLRTHDLVDAGPDGWVVRGRLSTFINVTGNKVAPTVIESALRGCAGVVDCAVVGVPDGEGGEQVAALIVAAPECDANSIRRHVGSRLRPYELPQRYTFADSVPRTTVGKTDYDAVARLLDRLRASAP